MNHKLQNTTRSDWPGKTMNFLRRIFGISSEMSEERYWIPKEDWPGYIADCIDHTISRDGLTTLGEALVTVVREDNRIRMSSAAAGKPAPTPSSNAAAFCYVQESKSWPDSLKFLAALEATGALSAPMTRMPVDILARSIAALLEERIDPK